MKTIKSNDLYNNMRVLLSDFLYQRISQNEREYGFSFISKNIMSTEYELSDNDVADLLRDKRLDHKNVIVFVPDSTETVSLGAFLLSSIAISHGIDIPETTKAMNERYSLDDQADMLKKSLPKAGVGQWVTTSDQMLLARIVSFVCASQESMNTWTGKWMELIQKRKRNLSPSLLDSFISFVRDDHPELLEKFDALPVIMPYAAIIDKEKFAIATEGISRPTLYEMTGNEYSDLSYNSRDDFLRRNIINALQVLKGKDLKRFICNEIGDTPIRERHVGVCAALLASSPKWDTELLDINELMSIRDRFYNFGAVSSMISNHMLNEPLNWLNAALEKPHCASLVREVATFARFDKWLARHVQSTQWGSLSYLKNLHSWISCMDNDNKHKSLNLLLDKFSQGISTGSLYGSGIFYGKVLLSAFPDDAYAEQAIKEQTGYLVKRALIDGDIELLRATYDRGWVSADRVAECIWSDIEFRKLTTHKGLPANEIRPFMPNKIKQTLFSEDLGI